VRRRNRVCQASYSVVKERMLHAWWSFCFLLHYKRCLAAGFRQQKTRRRAPGQAVPILRRNGFARCSTNCLSGIRNRPHSESSAEPESLMVMTLIETHLAETHRPTKKYSSIFIRVKHGIARFFRPPKILIFSSAWPLQKSSDLDNVHLFRQNVSSTGPRGGATASVGFNIPKIRIVILRFPKRGARGSVFGANLHFRGKK
jgi:hypothetical protein